MPPMAVVRSGKRQCSTSTPRPRRCSTSWAHWVLLPALSAPSNTMKAPRGVGGGAAIAGAAEQVITQRRALPTALQAPQREAAACM